MKESHTLSVTTASALKVLMSRILAENYPQVFHCCHALLAATEDLEQSDEVRLLKSSLDGIYNAIERLFYKEKIVLFPYLEKHFTQAGRVKTIPAIRTSTEEGLRTSKMICSIKDWTFGPEVKTASVLSKENIVNAFNNFEQAWNRLCAAREQLFNAFFV